MMMNITQMNFSLGRRNRRGGRGGRGSGSEWMPGGPLGGQEAAALGYSDVLLVLLAGFVALVVLPRAARRWWAARSLGAVAKKCT